MVRSMGNCLVGIRRINSLPLSLSGRSGFYFMPGRQILLDGTPEHAGARK